MKLKNLICAGLVAIAPSVAVGQEAVSKIVGYISLGDVTGGPAVEANTDITFSIPFKKATSFSGGVVSATANSITVGAGSFVAAEYSGATPYVVTIEDGSEQGASALVDSNSTDTLTITPTNAGDFSSVSAGDQLLISEAWTLSTLFDQVLPAGTRVFVFDGSTGAINEPATAAYVTNGSNGWFAVLGGSGPADDVIVYPGEAFVIRTAASAIAELSVSGEVPEYNSRIDVAKSAAGEQDVRVAFVSPIGERIADSGLGFNPGDRLLVFDQTVAGINKSASQSLVWSGTNWFGVIGLTGNQDDFELEGGKGYVYRFAAASPTGVYDWNDEQTYRGGL